MGGAWLSEPETIQVHRERADEESGFYYHGARYYVPWLCRWMAVDPLGGKYAPESSYCYGHNNPITWQDSTGMGPDIDSTVHINNAPRSWKDSHDTIYSYNGKGTTIQEAEIKGERTVPKAENATLETAIKPSFESSNKYTAHFEGGFVSDVRDPGGATNRGIIFSNFKKWAQPDLGIAPTLENLKKLTPGQAKELYHEHFWNKQNLDSFKNGNVAFAIYDFSVNSGGGVKAVEKAFSTVANGIKVDGKLTSTEISTLNQLDGKKLFDLVQNARRGYLHKVIDNNVKKYLEKHPNATKSELNAKTLLGLQKGLLDRVNSIKYEKK